MADVDQDVLEMARGLFDSRGIYALLKIMICTLRIFKRLCSHFLLSWQLKRKVCVYEMFQKCQNILGYARVTFIQFIYQ